MKYHFVTEGLFISRPNRFIAHVNIGGRTEVCHVKNTGRCRELLVPGAEVYLAAAHNPDRKTKYDLIAVQKGARLINMDSQAPNEAAAEWLQDRFPGAQIHREFTHGDSRFDFHLITDEGEMFIEVKGVTLEKDGHVLFPDAPTQRGAKHLNGLKRCVQEGHRAAVFFVIQMDDVLDFSPNRETDPAFSDALIAAHHAGVEIWCCNCRVTADSMVIQDPVPVVL